MDDDIFPRVFKLSDDGPKYMLAYEVARFLHQPIDQLFQLYPMLYRRQATCKERASLKLCSISSSPLVTLLLAEEVECILQEDDRELYLQPTPTPNQKQSKFGEKQPILLTTSSHAPPVPKQPDSSAKVSSPQSLFAPYYISPCGLASASDEENEHLAAISLNLDLNGHKLRDQFLWNTNDKSICVNKFARQLCQDLEIPMSYAHYVSLAIQSQIEAHHTLKEFNTQGNNLLIKIEVQLGMTQLVDQFEWDPSNPLNSPELFAKSLSRDLGLGPDYVVSIAVAIREKLLQAKQAMLDAPSVEQVVPILEPEELFRIADADEWGPALYTMTHRELEKKQTSEDRESRRRRRGRPEERQTKKTKRQQEQANQAEADYEIDLPNQPLKYTPSVRAYLMKRGFGDPSEQAWVACARKRQPMHVNKIQTS